MNLFYKKIHRLLRTFFLNIIFVITFAIIYSNMSSEFVLTNRENQDINFIDCLLTSTSIQAGVGITNIMPISNVSKIAMIIHQLLMITSHLLAIVFILVM